MINNDTITLSTHKKIQAAIICAVMFLCLAILFFINTSHTERLDASKNVAILIILLLTASALFIYSTTVAKKTVSEIKLLLLIATVIIVSFQLNAFFSEETSFYARPLLLPAMLITILIGRQTGLFINSLCMLIMYIFDVYSAGMNLFNPSSVYVLICMLVSGSFAVTKTINMHRRLDAVLTSFILGVPAMLSGVATYLLFYQGEYEMLLIVSIMAYLSSYISILFFLGLLPLLEKIFNIITNFRLNELTDHNRGLLKKLANLAPGTFNHSLAVSNLAEACALAIGENPQLARAAAYYHDIGKIRNPKFFKENQTGEDPHKDLTPELSVDFIKRHTIDGYNICTSNRLPQEISKICLEHHGTTIIRYFYYQASKFTDGELSYENFRYAGPKPSSKIAAIIMIADASEAAVRALPDRSKQSVEKTVRAIIDERMDFEQFSDCYITMKDIYTIIDTIVSITASYYHDRIDYPKLKFSNGMQNPENASATLTDGINEQ